MAITVNIPTILRPLTDNQRRIELLGATVQDIIENLEQQHTGIKEKLLADGQVHKFINIY